MIIRYDNLHPELDLSKAGQIISLYIGIAVFVDKALYFMAKVNTLLGKELVGFETIMLTT